MLLQVTTLNESKKWLFAFLAIATAVVLSMFSHWEPGGESWGYWFFSRIFSESGTFIIPDRSPLYTLYLFIFRWLGYPVSALTEYFVTYIGTCLCLVVLLRKYLGLGLAVFAAILWIPFMQFTEPPVQKLALSCSCLAIAARQRQGGSFRFVVSYALLGLAYLFRSIYILLIFIFVSYDTWKTFTKHGISEIIKNLRPRLSYLPIFIVLGMLVLFRSFQSPHPWNNAELTSTKWFPSKGKTLFEGGFMQAMNWAAIEDKYGTFEGKDFYFSNQELFGKAKTPFEMLRNNPRFIIKQILKNTKNIIPISASLMGICRTYLDCKIEAGLFKALRFLTVFLVVALVLFGAVKGAFGDQTMLLFVYGNFALIFITILSLPNPRYGLPLIPLYILSASWYSRKIGEKISRGKANKKVICLICSVIFLVIFSNSINHWWGRIIPELSEDFRNHDLRLLESRPYSMKGSYKEINSLVRDCRGVIALESLFVGAFTDIPIDKIYAVWEIPPFGYFGGSADNYLNPERIDSVLISYDLSTGIGCATNQQLRYKNYIQPYADWLVEKGAKAYDIKAFGKAIILRK